MTWGCQSAFSRTDISMMSSFKPNQARVFISIDLGKSKPIGPTLRQRITFVSSRNVCSEILVRMYRTFLSRMFEGLPGPVVTQEGNLDFALYGSVRKQDPMPKHRLCTQTAKLVKRQLGFRRVLEIKSIGPSQSAASEMDVKNRKRLVEGSEALSTIAGLSTTAHRVVDERAWL